MPLILILLQPGQQGFQRGLGVSNKTIINFAATPYLLASKIYLHDGRVLGKELLIGKVGAEQQQRITAHHCVIAGGESKQAGHAYIKRVVILDELLTAVSVHDGSLQLARELDQFAVSSGASGASKDGGLLLAIENPRKHPQFVIGRAHRRFRRSK